MRAKLRPGGTLLASIRDYDQPIGERPTVQGPAFYSDSDQRRIIFQVWDWADERRYTFHLYITRETPAGWNTSAWLPRIYHKQIFNWLYLPQ
jgi:glycine/sarcosine N-methyltransferase